MPIINWPNKVIVQDNLYYRAYLVLLERVQKSTRIRHSRKTRRLDPSLPYYEKHHIVPKSFSGSDQSDNLILLTGKEHYLAHRFLTRFTNGVYRIKMMKALDSMGMKSKNTTDRYRMPASVYQYNREQLSRIGCSDETKRKIGLANKGRSPSNKGQPRSAEVRAKISRGHVGKKGHPASPLTRRSASQYHSNAKWINNGELNKRIPLEDCQLWLTRGWSTGRMPIIHANSVR